MHSEIINDKEDEVIKKKKKKKDYQKTYKRNIKLDWKFQQKVVTLSLMVLSCWIIVWHKKIWNIVNCI